MSRVGAAIARGVLVAVAWGGVLAPALAQGPAGQRSFDSPEAAARALIDAARLDDEQALVEIFGQQYRDVVGTADKARDRELRARFARAADECRLLRRDGAERITLVVGCDAWPFPIPLVKQAAAWRFDTAAGWEEVVNRRVGANELAAIETLRAYVEAQRHYAAKARDGSGVRQFARKVRSAPGKQDGLYWEADPAKGEEPSPFGPLIGDAKGRRPGDPYNGYHFRILSRQGPAAPAGRYDYVINGRMIAGYAMIAYPADYGRTGVHTFVVNHYGVVHEKDLGRDTARIAGAMTEYNPDRSWVPVAE